MELNLSDKQNYMLYKLQYYIQAKEIDTVDELALSLTMDRMRQGMAEKGLAKEDADFEELTYRAPL